MCLEILMPLCNLKNIVAIFLHTLCYELVQNVLILATFLTES